MIVIVDYRMGNLGSIRNMFKKIGVAANVSSDADAIDRADKLILPGVGSFDNGMANLKEMGLEDVLTRRVVTQKVPVLGICLGMQLMTAGSEEGTLPGLGWVDARTIRFRHGDAGWKIPHMGWNVLEPKKTDSLFAGMYEYPRFYFVHSYHVVCSDADDVLATTSYGYDFVSAFGKGNIFGVQFHPEKSHRFGMKLLKTFVEHC